MLNFLRFKLDTAKGCRKLNIRNCLWYRLPLNSRELWVKVLTFAYLICFCRDCFVPRNDGLR